MTARRLPASRADEVVDVFADAFHDYPVMRFVLGDDGGDVHRLRRLIGLFVAARALRDEPLFGIEDPTGALLGAATMSLPGQRPAPEAFLTLREAVWAELGTAARDRYEAYGGAAALFPAPSPHHHLNMIGVRRASAGRGWSRPLLAAVHRLAAGDPASTGVTLSTERAANVPYYLHVGYQLLGHVVVGPGLETWSFFRPVHPSDRDQPPGR